MEVPVGNGLGDWRQSVCQDLRIHLVHKLVKCILPTENSQAVHDQNMHNVVAFAQKMERDMYEMANSKNNIYPTSLSGQAIFTDSVAIGSKHVSTGIALLALFSYWVDSDHTFMNLKLSLLSQLMKLVQHLAFILSRCRSYQLKPDPQ
uniref:KIX domain-containing protein n=1 Tax=Timema genevievae TaxID=629358 RepID=A0A7R9JXS4_TIMGE|nr:unnamed protein product [Timema genevievae]